MNQSQSPTSPDSVPSLSKRRGKGTIGSQTHETGLVPAAHTRQMQFLIKVQLRRTLIPLPAPYPRAPSLALRAIHLVAAQPLYGFIDEEEKSCFLMLTSVNGVGPKAALSILSVAPPDRLALSIITGDEKMLMQAPGIGKKIAQRIVLELRDKMSKEQLETASAASPVAAAAVSGGVNHTQEAVAALMVLGYTQAEALHAMEGLDAAGMEADEIIRQCLKKLVKS